MIELSIIILNYNTPELTIDCLKSIENAVVGVGDVEVIVVDNGSSDDSVIQLKKLQITNYKLQIIESDKNLGFAKGNNFGLNYATGKYILFLNSDTIINIAALSKSLLAMYRDKNIGALSVKTLLPSGRIDSDCHRGFPTPWASLTYFLGFEKLFPRTKLFGQYHQGFLDMSTNHQIPAGAGAYMMISRDVINKVGTWDESYFFYGEDLDYFYRINKAGYKVYFLADNLVTHYKGASSGLRKETSQIQNNSKENRIRVAKASVKAMEIFYKKFYKNRYPFLLTFLVLAGIRIKGMFRLVYHYLR